MIYDAAVNIKNILIDGKLSTKRAIDYQLRLVMDSQLKWAGNLQEETQRISGRKASRGTR